MTVNALGQPLTMTDRNGTVHTLAYDILGRVTVDTVTTLGSGVDGSVRRVETAYDSQGNAYLLTTYDATTSGNIVTQLQRAFNGLGQMTREWQSHSGAVNTSTTPSVQYAYSEMAGGTNHSRLESITYPNGFVLTYNYASGLNGDISRLSSLSDSSGILESYDYLGFGTVVRRSHPQPDLDLTFLGTGPGSGGDQYVGLDSFSRVIDHHWKTSSSTTDRFTYTYDRNGNRLSKGNGVNSAYDESYAYDNLNQLSSFTRGSYSQSWDFDAMGNWDSVTTNGTTQTRSANKQNEITSVSGATTPTYDANGNMTTDETGRQFVYDGWNRLKFVKNSGGTTLKTYTYDALNRRVAEVAGGNTSDLYYSANWQVLEERINGSGKYRFVWSPVYVDAMVLRDRLDASDRIWVQQDANFNVTGITDGSGNVLERYIYDPYGNVTVTNASWGTLSISAYAWQYLHQGGRLDTVSALYYFRYRDYSTTLGRWVSIDPLRFSANDTNLFRALNNNALNSIDPMGLCAPDSCGPEVTKWFNKELELFTAKFLEFVKWYKQHRDKVNKMWWYFRKAGEANNIKIWFESFSHLAGRMTDYKDRNKAAALGMKSEPFDYSKCKDPDQNTVTLCGTCIGTNQLGNILYGVLAVQFNLENEARSYGRGELNKLTGWMPSFLKAPYQKLPWTDEGQSHRQEAFEVGVELMKELKTNKSANICDFVKKHQLSGGHTKDETRAWLKKPCDAPHAGPNTDLSRESLVDAGGNSIIK